jgi:hypothetical protein
MSTKPIEPVGAEQDEMNQQCKHEQESKKSYQCPSRIE